MNGVTRAYRGLTRRRQFALALLAGLAAAPAALAQPFGVAEAPAIAYGPLPSQVGDVFSPIGATGKHAAVVIIHGGGWVEGSRAGAESYARAFALMGVVAFNIDYRLANKADPSTHWPAQLVDAQLAVRYLRAHADQFGIDPARIGAVGDSAGGQLAVFLGVLPRIVPGDMAGLYASEAPDVKDVVDQFGVMDLPGMGKYGVFSTDSMFGTTTPSYNEFLTASPLPSVTAQSAPVYIIHGEADEVVPFEQSVRLEATLKAHGVPVTLVRYKGGHGYTGIPDKEIGTLQWDALLWLVGHLRA